MKDQQQYWEMLNVAEEQETPPITMWNAYKPGEMLFVLRPHLQINEKFGNVPEPDTKHYFRSEEHMSELQSRPHLVCRLLLEKKKNQKSPSYCSSQSLDSVLNRCPSSIITVDSLPIVTLTEFHLESRAAPL